MPTEPPTVSYTHLDVYKRQGLKFYVYFTRLKHSYRYPHYYSWTSKSCFSTCGGLGDRGLDSRPE